MIVSGVTRKLDQCERGSAPLSIASSARSAGRNSGSLDLAAQHVELVAEHDDLDVFGVLAAEASKQHADEPACHEVEEGQSHRPIVSDAGSSLLSAHDRVSEPYALARSAP